MRSTTVWIIEDWTGRRMFPDRQFATFMDGLEFIMGQFPNDEDLEDIYIERA